VQALRVTRQVTQRDVVTFDYDHNNVVFEDERNEPIDMQTVYAGWSRDFGAHAQLVLRGGPRLTNGFRGTDFAASVIRNWKSGSIAFSVDQNQTTVVGYVGAVETQSVQTKLTWSPGHRLVSDAGAGYQLQRRHADGRN
jgi:hypothetical protein